jgi:hypothetical protein
MMSLLSADVAFVGCALSLLSVLPLASGVVAMTASAFVPG